MIALLLRLADLTAAHRRIRQLTAELATAQQDLTNTRASLSRVADECAERDKALSRLRTERSSSVRPLTRQQRAALAHLVDTAERHNLDVPEPHDLDIAFLPEVSPGRGHDIRVWWCDGEHVLAGQLDVYGHGHVALGDVTWVCNDGDEDSTCPVCHPVEDRAEVADHA